MIENVSGAVRVLPFVQSRELVFLLVAPLRSSLEVVLEPQATADRASAGEMLRNVFPFHTVAA